MANLDDENYEELEIVEGYFSPYCIGCDTTLLFWWRQYLGGSDSEKMNCPNCGQELGMLETEFKLLGQMKGNVGEDIFKFKLIEPEKHKFSSLFDYEGYKKPQSKTLLTFDERNPSEESESPWIYAHRKVGEYPSATKRNGKWLVFVPLDEVDEVWAVVKKATQDGTLGSSSKVATAYDNGLYDPHIKVICIYTYDWKNEEDVKRIREELRNLGITRKIAYKSDEDTLNGRYKRTGHIGISKYYE